MSFNNEENEFLKFMEEIILDYLENDVYCNVYSSLEELENKIFNYYEYDGEPLGSYCYNNLQEDVLYYFDVALSSLIEKDIVKEFILPDGSCICYTNENNVTEKFY